MTAPIRVLHLEDSPRDAQLIRDKMKAEGLSCDISWVEERVAFEAALAQDPFDLILCDYNLPRCDATSALQAAWERQPDVPVIVISGWLGEEDAAKCLHLGVTDYVLKHRLDRLGSAVNRALREADAHRQRRQAEEKLLSGEKQLRALIENASDLVTIVDRDGSIHYASPSHERVLGYRPEEMIGQPILTFVHPDDRARVGSAFRQDIESGSVGALVQFRNRHRDGSWRDMEAIGKGLDGQPGLGVVNTRDVTQRLQLESQLRQSQKMEAIGRLAGGVAHDFNNQIFVINGYCDLLLADAAEHPAFLEAIAEIKKAAHRSAELTAQLLAFSRKQVLQPRVLDLHAELIAIEPMLRRLIGEDIQLTLMVGEDVGHTRVDPNQLQQVVMNLAVNARDAMPDGGQLTIETDNVQVDDAYAESRLEVTPGSYLLLSISDTGHGMDRETLAHLFEPFFTTKGPGKGTGLGLATVHGIMKQSGGHVAVYSEPGRGTTFKIYLPRVDEAVEMAPRRVLEEAVGGSETILLVEDEAGLR
jgi:PAS domain S-box-containing protein